MSFSAYEFVRDICNFLVPAQAVLWLQEPLLRDPNHSFLANIRASLPFLMRSGLICAFVTGLAEWGKHVDVWPAHPGFPSGHATLCAALAVCLIAQRGLRWAFLLVPMALLMPTALVMHGAHDRAEAVGGLAFGATLTAALWRLTTPRPVAPTGTDTP